MKILAKCHVGDQEDHKDLYLTIKHQDEEYIVAKEVYNQHMKDTFTASGSVTERRSNPGNYSRNWLDEIDQVFMILPDCYQKRELLHSIKLYKKIRMFLVKTDFLLSDIIPCIKLVIQWEENRQTKLKWLKVTNV